MDVAVQLSFGQFSSRECVPNCCRIFYGVELLFDDFKFASEDCQKLLRLALSNTNNSLAFSRNGVDGRSTVEGRQTKGR